MTIIAVVGEFLSATSFFFRSVVFAERAEYFWTYRRYMYASPMTNSSKLPPQVLYPLLQQQLAKLCRQGVIDAVDLFDLQLAIEICEAEMGIDRRPS